MKGIIVNYRLPYTKEVVVRIPGIDTRRKAAKLVGKKIIWRDERKSEYFGKITAPHGNSGCVRAKFTVPLPAKSLGKEVEIEE